MSGIALTAVLSALCLGQIAPPARNGPERWDTYGKFAQWDTGTPPDHPKHSHPHDPNVTAPLPSITNLPAAPRKQYGPANVRRDLSTLAPDSPTLTSMRKAIDAMKKLPASDPHNWTNWANIHSFPDGTPNPDPLWNQCQHGNWWFLPWHRAYLVYTERVMRKYAEDPSFALPYWDYSAEVSRSLPVPYRDPTSPLYDGTRRGIVNNGSDTLNPLVVVLGTNFSLDNRTFGDFGNVSTFGGQAINAPQHRGSPHGAIEAIPHDLVHAFVGGNMSDANMAGRDPIFFAHHCNIDRLWVAWLQMGQGRANPSNDVWLNQTFTFYDENKQRATVKVSELLDPAALGYVYDRPTPAADAPSRPAPQTAVDTVATLRTPNTSLTNQPVTFTVKVPGQMRRLAGTGHSPLATDHLLLIHLQMEECTFKAADSIVAVYINLPPGTPIPSPVSGYYAGCFTFFGDHGHQGGMASQIDVTRNLQRLLSTQSQQQNVTVTLVRMSPGLVLREFQTPCTFNQLSLTVTK